MVAPSPFTGTLGPPRLPSYLPFGVAATTPYMSATVNNTTTGATIEVDNIGGFASVTIYRVVGTKRTAVRGASGIQPSGVTTATFTDFEAPLGVAFTYVLNGDGHDFYTVGPFTITYATTDYWLKDPANSAVNVKVDVESMSAVTRPARILVASNVLGRQNQHIVSDVRGGRTGTIKITTDNLTEQAQIVSLFSTGDVLFFQCPPQYGFADMYFAASDLIETWEGVAGETIHSWQFQFTEVDSPADSSSTEALNTYLRVMSFGTYQNLLNKRATYQLVVADVWTSADGTG